MWHIRNTHLITCNDKFMPVARYLYWWNSSLRTHRVTLVIYNSPCAETGDTTLIMCQVNIMLFSYSIPFNIWHIVAWECEPEAYENIITSTESRTFHRTYHNMKSDMCYVAIATTLWICFIFWRESSHIVV
jgi:hypothetical protein